MTATVHQWGFSRSQGRKGQMCYPIQWYTDIKKDGCLSGKENKILLKKYQKSFVLNSSRFLGAGLGHDSRSACDLWDHFHN